MSDTRTEWTSVSESLPDADVTVLVHAPSDSEPVWPGFFDGDVWRSVDGMRLRHRVTHWMNFPEPPE